MYVHSLPWLKTRSIPNDGLKSFWRIIRALLLPFFCFPIWFQLGLPYNAKLAILPRSFVCCRALLQAVKFVLIAHLRLCMFYFPLDETTEITETTDFRGAWVFSKLMARKHHNRQLWNHEMPISSQHQTKCFASLCPRIIYKSIFKGFSQLGHVTCT